MHNEATVIGRVTAVFEDKDARFVVVEDKSNPKYPVSVACRFYGKPKEQTNDVGNGELVKVTGNCKSREHQGRWYTDFSAWRLTRLVQEIPMVSRSAKPAASEEAPPVDDSDVPF